MISGFRHNCLKRERILAYRNSGMPNKDTKKVEKEREDSIKVTHRANLHRKDGEQNGA